MPGGNAKAAAALVAGFVLGAFTFWAVSDGTPAAGRAATAGSSADAGRAPAAPPRSDAPGRAERTPRARAAVDGGRRADPATATSRNDPTAVPGRSASAAGGAEAATLPDPARGGGTAPDPAGEAAGAGPGVELPVPPPTSSEGAGPSSPEREARGVVVDAATQQPLDGARVLLAALDGPQSGAWWGATSDAEGRFAVRVTDERALPARFQLRVSRDGYDAARVAPAAGEIRVQLRLRATPMLPGRVLGTARTADGKPFAGELDVDGFDEHGGNVTQRTVADALGKFALEGVPPGRWRISWLRGPRAEVTVPDGGDAAVEVAPPADGRGDGLVVTDVDPAAVRVDDPVAAARLAELLRLMAETQASQALGETVRERLVRAYAQEVQILAGASQAGLPRRAVTVTGLAPAGRAWLRLEWKPRHFWRVEVRDGAAQFPPVAVGEYTAVLVQPGSPDVAAQILVAPGEGVLDREFVR